MNRVVRILCCFIFFFPMSALFAKEKDIKICLTMVVKDDASTLMQCLNSVEELIDCVCVCDLGSNDSTLIQLETFFQNKGVPGKIYRIADKNKTQNKNQSIAYAQKALKQWNFSPKTTYLLCLDSTMTVHSLKPFDKQKLSADAYLIQERSPLICRYTPYLLKASKPWKATEAVFVDWKCQQSCDVDHQFAFVVENQKQDLSKELLKDDTLAHPFYGALIDKQLKNYDEAIEGFKKAITKNSNPEEVWYSKLQLGHCYELKGMHEQAVESYHEAFRYNPHRAEPLKALATFYRSKGQNDIAYNFAKQGLRLGFPKSPLFIIPEVYEYQLDEELSIVAFYTPFREEGFAAANRLLLKKHIPNFIKDQTYQNVLFYAEPLKEALIKPIQFKLPLIQGSLKCYNPLNPSIQKTDNGYKVICRTVNYEQIGPYFKYIDETIPNQKVNTRNYLLDYDEDFNLLSQKEILEKCQREKHPNPWWEGIEDCRLFQFQEGFWCTCTTTDTSPGGRQQISLCKLSSPVKNETVDVEKLIPLNGPDPLRNEKNWLPFIYQDKLHVVYSFDPFIVFQPNIETGDCITTCKNSISYDFSQFRGSAPPIEFDEGYLCVVHEVVKRNGCNYVRRFLFLDKNLNIQKVSKPFIFTHVGIEICCGMAIDGEKKKLVLATASEDREAFLCIVDCDQVRSMLEPLPGI